MKTNFKIKLVLIAMITTSCVMNTDSSVLVERISSACNCKEVVSGMTSNGITFSKKGASSIGERHEIFLKNCKVSDYKNEAEKIVTDLKNQNLCNDVFIVLNFENEENLLKEFQINNCQLKKND